MTTGLECLIKKAKATLKAEGRPEDYIVGFYRVWRSFSSFCTPKPNKRFSKTMANRYLKCKEELCASGKINYATLMAHKRAISYLSEIGGFGPLAKKTDRAKHSGKPHSRRVIKVRGPRLRALDDAFCKHLACNNYSKSTVCYYAIEARKFLRWIGEPVFDGVSPGDVIAYLRDMDAEPTAAQLTIMRRLLVFLHQEGLAAEDLSGCLPRLPSRRRRETEFLTNEEELSLLESFDDNDPRDALAHAIILLALRTGLRSSDVCALGFRDIDFTKKEISITQAKTGRYLHIPITDDAAAAISHYVTCHRPQGLSDNVFLGVRGRPLSSCGAISRSALDRAGIRIGEPKRGFHLFRFTFAARMVAKGIPIDIVSEILGHASKDSARPYIAFDSQALRCCTLPLSDIYGR
jgi:integrase